MKIKLDGENGIFLLSDETGVKIYNIGEIENEIFFYLHMNSIFKIFKNTKISKDCGCTDE